MALHQRCVRASRLVRSFARSRRYSGANVLHADMLQDADTAEVVDYRPEDGDFTREWSLLVEEAAP